MDKTVIALRMLIGGDDVKKRQEVADAIDANEQYLYQIARGIPLPSGKPRSTELRFLAIVWPTGNQSAEVFLPDLPSFMMFIRDHGAAFNTRAMVDRQARADYDAELARRGRAP